jgi:outer membrane protein OmpA-like peptidoglycan-associated protein
LVELRATLTGLRQAVDDLATKVPGGAELRAKYFNADEVLGVLDAKMKWLSGEIASARHDLKQSEVASLRDAITQTAKDLGQVSKVAFELTHEKSRLERLEALLKAPYEHQLATGYLVKAASDGAESRLIACIENTSATTNPTSEIGFDRLVLVAGGDDLDLGGSRSQLENVAQILRAYPTLKLKIVGHPDSRGPSAANRKRVAELAEAVRQALVVSGVSADRLTAAGDGSRRPACRASAANDCQASNPRIAALVTAR